MNHRMRRIGRIGRIRTVGLVAAGWGLLSAANCSRDDDARVADSAGGLVAIDTTFGEVAYRDVNYRLTSDNFAKFQVAQERIDALPQPPVVQRIDLRAPREDDVAVVVNQLEADEPSRTAIVSTGLSVRDFVLTSLALGQALAFGNDQRVLVFPENRLFLEDTRVGIDRLESRRRFRIGGRGNEHGNPGLAKGHGKDKGKGKGKGKG